MTSLYSPEKHQRRRLLKRSNPLFFRQMTHVANTAVAFRLPNTEVQLLVSLVEEGSPLTAGPGFTISSTDEFYATNQGKLDFLSTPVDIPPGRLVIAKDPAGNTLQFLSVRHSE
jgi:hypothetical protein